ncbi:hypothetical protein M0R45_026263 [Rubus argutus]|uniref:Response regulatory domain-containing protein n=1 Tax=Rubus argutus TaxID=59490 RepID=A0AAW1WXP3_RUBAR
MAKNLDSLDVSSMSNFENAHMLVVDDNAVNLKLIECWLKSSSCKVTAVDSGLRALQFLEVDGLKVDLIITDYCMPKMNGYELLKKIKESPNFKEVPVVIMSSDNVLTHINMCLNEGAIDFLLKSVKISDIEELSLYMKKDVGGVKESGINKRKLGESSGQPSSPPSILPQTTSLSSPSPPLSSTSSFSASSSGQLSSPPSILPQTASLLSPSPPLSSTSSFSAPSS